MDCRSTNRLRACRSEDLDSELAPARPRARSLPSRLASNPDLRDTTGSGMAKNRSSSQLDSASQCALSWRLLRRRRINHEKARIRIGQAVRHAIRFPICVGMIFRNMNRHFSIFPLHSAQRALHGLYGRTGMKDWSLRRISHDGCPQ